MRTLYAIQFEVIPHGSISSGELSTEVLRSIGSWIAEWYLVRETASIDFPISGGRLQPRDNHEIAVVRNVSLDARSSHSIVTWSYPYENDGNILWHSKCEVSEFNGLVEFSLQLSLDSIQFYIAPVDFDLRRPRLIGTLIKQFDCVYGDTHLTLEPRTVSALQVGEFVQRRLYSTQRRLPIVLTSRPALGKWLVDPSDLAERLAGIAEIYALEDKWAGYALTEQIGKLYGCYNGAVRVYWPDFDPEEAPYSPIYIPERLQVRGGKLVEDLFRQFSAISTFRFVPGPVSIDAGEFLESQRQAELDRIRTAAQQSGDYEQLMQIAENENFGLQSQLKAARQENDQLRASLQMSQDNLRAVWRTGEDRPVILSTETTPEDTEIEPSSVKDAVCSARTSFADTLIFQETALASAGDSPFKQPKKVYQAFLAMHEVCLSWRQSRSTKSPMGSPEQSFAGKGFTYKVRESATSKGKWPDEYQMIYRGGRVSIEQHLALGKGGPDTCLRIHFYTDEKEQKYVIAHVGRHKTNTKT